MQELKRYKKAPAPVVAVTCAVSLLVMPTDALVYGFQNAGGKLPSTDGPLGMLWVRMCWY